MKPKELELLHHLTRFSLVSDAARALFMTQPNGSKMLKKIEQRFDFKLFERVNGRLRPTAEGHLKAEQPEFTLISQRRFEARTRNMRDMHLGSLRHRISSKNTQNLVVKPCSKFRGGHLMLGNWYLSG